MADPAWGATSSLSDEETAHALCAFHHTEPLPTQRRRSLYLMKKHQQAAPLYQPRSNYHEMQPQRASTGFSTFEYPVVTTHVVSMSAQRSEATTMFVGMPSTISDDWHRHQQRAIQEQIEQQQRELQAQLHRQQQREMQLGVQRMQAQIQQQEQQMQVQRQVENTQQPRYSSGFGGFEQARWNNGVYTSQPPPTTSTSYNGERQDAEIQRQQQRDHQSYTRRFGPTASASTPSFVSGYNVTFQAGMSMSRNQEMFAPQQVPQPAQSHLQARNPGIFPVGGHEWERHDPMLFSRAPTDRTPMFQTQRTEEFVPQQPMRSKLRPDEFVLDGIMKHFQTNGGSSAGAPAASTSGSYDMNAGFAGAPNVKPVFNSTVNQTRIQSSTGVQTQGQLNSHLKVPVPPTGTAVVPGIALASQSMRLLTMRDILNVEDGAIKMDSLRNRQRGAKQKRALPNRKVPRKKTTVKRQRTPQQQNERRFQPIQSRQGASPAPIGVSGPVAKMPTPMYLAFMESRAARVLEQTVGNANTTVSSPGSQQPAPASGSTTNSISRVNGQDVAVTAQSLVKRKKTEEVPPRICHPSSTYQPYHQPVANTTSSRQAADKEASGPQPSTTQTLQMESEHHALVSDLALAGNGFDRPRNGAFGMQQSRPKVPISNKLECSAQVGVVQNGKASASSRKRPRAKLPTAGLKPLAATGVQQQAAIIQVPNEVLPSESGLKAATAVNSSSVAQAPAASAVPRAENRTVVIFCKRDFMRYQAAKIWRKYQEQLKKHEEWREVRVAGKRTRYLNSRYDELQRTHKRTYTRSGKPRRKASQAAKGARRRKALLASADSAPVDATVPSLMLFDDEIETRKPGQTVNGESGAAGDAHSISANGSENDCPRTVQDASDAQENQLATTEDETIKSSSCNDSSNGGAADSKTHQGLDRTVSGTYIANVLLSSDTVAGAPPCGNVEVNSLVDGSPQNADRSVAEVSRQGGAEITDATPSSNIPTTGASAFESTSGEATVQCIDAHAIAATPSNGTIEVIGLTPRKTMDNVVVKAVELVDNTSATDWIMDTDAKIVGDSEGLTGNDKARVCGEQSCSPSLECTLSMPEQSPSVTENTDSAAQLGTPPEQQATAKTKATQ